ncbi:hypothetical protein [Legionella quateirensis]|uniref:Coiled-coil protein n=1 Tax=Legionella quateirensis TaxID=45072 RepID=A0A378KVS4_9GAMM|nr:hypothetical protein [Legionella quateirensis]KTD52603.1 hypothetical protein Lqua_0886 [Legionella quateirensis]STY18466.1 Uncharacterised protein [Legionella quateirensis]
MYTKYESDIEVIENPELNVQHESVAEQEGIAIKISPFQALTILAKKYKNTEMPPDQAQLFAQVKHLFLMGVQNEQDLNLFKSLLKDDALKGYEIPLIEHSEFELLKRNVAELSDEENDKYSEAIAKLELINNDPVRRYFESILCHDTLRSGLDDLNLISLKKHFKTVFASMPMSMKILVPTTIYNGDVEGAAAQKSATAPEYITAIQKLRNPENFPSFKPENEIGEKSPNEVLRDRTNKMMLLVKTIHAGMTAVNQSKQEHFPLNIYGEEGSVYSPSIRGRIDRKDQHGDKQEVRSNNLGIMRSYMPLSSSDVLYEAPSMDTANQYRRPADASTYVPNGDIPQKFFSTQVSPFVNSISGTMLTQLRVMADLLNKNEFQFQDDPEQLKAFFKCFISYMIYNSGGHSLQEFTAVFDLPQVQAIFKDVPGFEDLNLKNLFQEENDINFMNAMNEVIEYNSEILQKKALHRELTEPTLDRELSEGEDELTERARGRLRSPNVRLDEISSLERRDREIDEAYIHYSSPINKEIETEEEYNLRVTKAEGLLVDKFNIKWDHNSDQKEIKRHVFTQIMSNMSERQDKLIREFYHGKGTLAQRLDKAWEIYKDDKRTDEDRIIAQNYMIFILDINDKHVIENLNEKLVQLMLERELNKVENPDFIPGKSPIVLAEKSKSGLKQTENSGETEDEEVLALINKKDLLDVNPNSKLKDKGELKNKFGIVNAKKTEFFNAEERDMLRVLTRNGIFYSRDREVFDTQKSISHDKKGFAAYTLNVNGELSVFQHIDHDKTGIAHSSMNAGVPVVSAGEIEIKNGKLISITEHSGHYRPSLYNMYKTLDYFRKQGVDISDVKVYTFTSSDTIEKQLRIDVSQSKEFSHFRVINADELCNSLYGHLKLVVNQAKKDLEAYQSPSFMKFLNKVKDFITGSTLTNDREMLAKKLSEGIVALAEEINSANSLDSLKKINDKIDKLIDDVQGENMEVNLRHGKDKNQGNFAQRTNLFREQLKGMRERLEETKENGLETLSEEDILSCSDQLKSMGRK